MSQVNKIDEVLRECQSFIDDEAIQQSARIEAKQALLSAILEVMPEKQRYKNKFVNALAWNDAELISRNRTVDEMEEAIKELFGVEG